MWCFELVLKIPRGAAHLAMRDMPPVDFVPTNADVARPILTCSDTFANLMSWR